MPTCGTSSPGCAYDGVVIVALVVLSALLHALWNAQLRLESRKDQVLVIATAVATLVGAGVATVRWLLGEALFPSLASLGFSVVAGVLEAVYFAALARAMELGRLGVVYTISRGGAVLVVWPLSIALFGEAATLSSIGGSAVVLAGLSLSGLGARRGGPSPSAGSAARAAIGWAVVCAMAIAGYHLAYTAALDRGANPSGCFAVALGVATAINASRLGAARAELMPLARQRWRQATVMGLLCSGSFLILLEALARGGAGYVLTLRNTSVLFAVAMGWRIGERPKRAELAGAALVAAGAVLMAL